LFAPPPTCPVRVHSRARTLSGPEPGGSEEPRADGTTRPASFRPRGFAPPRRFPPHLKFAGLLRPAAGHEVRRVSLKPATMAPNPRPRRLRVVVAGHRSGRGRYRGESGLAPRDAMTLRRVPPVHSRTVSPPPGAPLPLSLSRRDTPDPLPVAGRRSKCLPGETLDFEALLCERVRCVRHPCGHLDRSFLPWACVPFVARLPPQPPRTFRGRPGVRPTLRRSGPSGRPWRRGESLRSSRGHPSRARGPKATVGSLSGGVVVRVRRRGRPPWGSRR